MRSIKLTKGFVVLVDDIDYETLNEKKWYLLQSGKKQYAATYVKGKHILMHRFVLNAPDGLDVDHIDGDGLNNTRSNLRIATRTQNMMNSRGHRDSLSGYKGVTWDKKLKKWHAQIQVNGKKTHLGFYVEIEKAIEAYDIAAKERHGDFFRPRTLDSVP